MKPIIIALVIFMAGICGAEEKGEYLVVIKEYSNGYHVNYNTDEKTHLTWLSKPEYNIEKILEQIITDTKNEKIEARIKKLEEKCQQD